MASLVPTRYPLATLPTPIQYLARASDDLGIELWIKRDDLTGFALGGNKARKLEYLIAQAIADKVDVIVTCGSVQSNFIRMLSAACAVAGITCSVVAMHHPFEPGGEVPSAPVMRGGNEIINRWTGLDMMILADGSWDSLFESAENLANSYRKEGKTVLNIPVGGSSPLGAYAFFEAAKEVPAGFDIIVTASSSGSTQVGLATAFRGTATHVTGIVCDPEPQIANDFAGLAADLMPLVGDAMPLMANDFDVRFDYVGPGYGVSSPDGEEAILYLARCEGIFLDQIYSGKAFAGLMDMATKGELKDKRVLFWHTGGTPTLFATTV